MDKIALSIKECAQLMGVTMPTVYKLINNDKAKFPAFRVGRRWIIPVKGVEDWLGKMGKERAELPLEE